MIANKGYILYCHKKASRDLFDYKLWCFGGSCEFILVCSNRFSKGGMNEDFYDTDWNHLSLRRPNHQNSENIIEMPSSYRTMECFAEKLTNQFPFGRVDFYEVNGKLFFGEITFYPASGFEAFVPDEMDTELGNLIKL